MMFNVICVSCLCTLALNKCVIYPTLGWIDHSCILIHKRPFYRTFYFSGHTQTQRTSQDTVLELELSPFK